MKYPDANDYLWLVLAAVANNYREKWDDNNTYSVLKHGTKLRIKFLDEDKDKEWQEFCTTHGLQQDHTLEY